MNEISPTYAQRSGRAAWGSFAMASTAFPAATAAAVEILKAGGNAVDAAVAAAWALSVCEPSGSGLGGQTTLLIHFPTAGRRSWMDTPMHRRVSRVGPSIQYNKNGAAGPRPSRPRPPLWEPPRPDTVDCRRSRS